MPDGDAQWILGQIKLKLCMQVRPAVKETEATIVLDEVIDEQLLALQEQVKEMQKLQPENRRLHEQMALVIDKNRKLQEQIRKEQDG